jgi:hypothetical protein
MRRARKAGKHRVLIARAGGLLLAFVQSEPFCYGFSMTKQQVDASPARLSDAQAKEVERRRAAFAAGAERYATDEEMAALWKKLGLKVRYRKRAKGDCP